MLPYKSHFFSFFLYIFWLKFLATYLPCPHEVQHAVQRGVDAVPDHRLRVVRDRLKTPGEIIVGKVAITHDENMRIIVTVSCEKWEWAPGNETRNPPSEWAPGDAIFDMLRLQFYQNCKYDFRIVDFEVDIDISLRQVKKRNKSKSSGRFVYSIIFAVLEVVDDKYSALSDEWDHSEDLYHLKLEILCT